MHGVLAAAGAHLQHPRLRRQPLAQHLQDRLLVAFAGLGETHGQRQDSCAILTGPSSRGSLTSGRLPLRGGSAAAERLGDPVS